MDRADSAPTAAHPAAALPSTLQPSGSGLPPVTPDGQSVAAAAVRARHPEGAANKSFVLDLAYEEYCQRLEAGQTVDSEEFCSRFPRFQSSLRRLLGVHQFLQENPQLLTGAVAAWPEAGQGFLGFALLRELGRGAFARVFLASEPALGGRLVAVKITRLGAAEAQTLGRLGHPNIVPIHSTQTDPHTGFTVICMPYLGSATLCDVLDRAFAAVHPPRSGRVVFEAARDLTEADASSHPPAKIRSRGSGTYLDTVVYIGSQLADALAFAHALGICHRDLKPSNVLLAADGRPMLLDFNLSSDRQIAENRLGGTLPYMAPEQLRATDPSGRADAALLDARSDLFSLGVILYELLAGMHPFGSMTTKRSAAEARRDLLEQQRQGVRPLRATNPQVDRALAYVVECCLAYDPAKRPQTAAELGTALRRALSLRRRVARWLAGHRWTVVGTGVAAVIMIALAGYALSSRDPYSVRQWRSGLTIYRQGNYRAAVEHFNRALDADAASAAVLFSRGRARQQLGDWSLALADYQAADDLVDDGPTRAAAGYCLCRLELYREAILSFRRANELGFASAEAFNDLGYCYLQMGELEPAKDALDRAVGLNPALQASYYNRALFHFQAGLNRPSKVNGAGLDDARRALEIGPATTDILRHAAGMASEAGQHDLALEYLRQAIDQGQDVRPLQSDRAFRALSTDPRFHELLRDGAAVPRPHPTKSVRLLDPINDASS